MFNVKQLKMNKFIKYIWSLIISTLNATLEVPSLRPCLLTIIVCQLLYAFPLFKYAIMFSFYYIIFYIKMKLDCY